MIKVLFVTYDFPFPLNSGGKNRAFNMMKFSKNENLSIDLLSFVREGFNEKYVDEIKKIGVNDVQILKRRKLKSPSTIGKNLVSSDSIFKTLYYNKEFDRKLEQMIEKNDIDIVHFESSYVGYYISDELRKKGVKQVLGTENIEHLLYKEFLSNSKNLIKKTVLSYQVERFKKEEDSMMEKADICIAVTGDEAEYISKLTSKKSYVVENAISVDSLKFKFDRKVRNNILFVGNFVYMPNILAIKYFVDRVLPLLDKKITLTIVGKKVTDVVSSSKRIVAVDYVEDLIGEYRKADLMVFPIKIGGGTNYKVLEAMALGVPIVAFPDKVNSIGAIEDVDYFKVENELEFAEKIHSILNNKNSASEVVKSARGLVEKNYSWEVIGLKLYGIWKNLKDE